MFARPRSAVSLACTLLALLAYGCGSGARDVTAINPVPEDPLPGNSHVDAGQPDTDAGTDAGSDSGVDAGGPMDAGVDSGPMMDAGMGVTCAPDLPTSCANAANHTVMVAAGQFADLNAVVDGTGDDYFLLTFTGAAGATVPYHPKIVFNTNPGNVFSFEVLSACGSPASGCTPGLTTYEAVFPGTQSLCDQTNSCVDNSTRVTSYVVHVSRSNVANNCFQYSLHISNQP